MRAPSSFQFFSAYLRVKSLTHFRISLGIPQILSLECSQSAAIGPPCALSPQPLPCCAFSHRPPCCVLKLGALQIRPYHFYQCARDLLHDPGLFAAHESWRLRQDHQHVAADHTQHHGRSHCVQYLQVWHDDGRTRSGLTRTVSRSVYPCRCSALSMLGACTINDYVAPAHLASAVCALSFVSVSPLLQVCLKSMGRSLASPPTLCGPLRWSRATHRSTLNWVTRRCGARQQSCQTVYWRLCLKIALSLDIS